MAQLIKMTVLMFMLNLYIYVGISFTQSLPDVDKREFMLNDQLKFHFDNDLISQWMGGTDYINQLTNSTLNNYTAYGYNISGGITVLPKKTGGSFGISTLIDVVDATWDFIAVFANIAISPLTLFFNYRMPSMIGLLIAFPFIIGYILGIIYFVRGIGS